MTAPRQKAPLRVIHCHGCDMGVLVQYNSVCPRPECGEPNTALQVIQDRHCNACGEFVEEYTESAEAHIRKTAEAS